MTTKDKVFDYVLMLVLFLIIFVTTPFEWFSRAWRRLSVHLRPDPSYYEAMARAEVEWKAYKMGTMREVMIIEVDPTPQIAEDGKLIYKPIVRRGRSYEWKE